MRTLRSILQILVMLVTGVTAAAGEDIARAAVNVNVQVSSRTSLRVSSELLRFDVAQPGGAATAAIDFAAGARTPAGSDIVLTIEPLRGLDGPGGAADAGAALSFSGEGQGLLAGQLPSAQTTVIGRWHGSGVREGRVVFTLRADAAGTYSMPVRFVLSTP